MTEYKKLSKKAQKALNAQKRNTVSMNTGTRIHRSERDYSRQRAKREMMKEYRGE